MRTPQRKLPANQRRAKKHGWANQLSYEAKERAQRDALRKKVATRKVVKPVAQKRRSDGRGMDAGTMGRSRL